MKKALIIMIMAAMSANIYGQAPERMSYQAVVRNSSGDLINSATVGMQISILRGSAMGAAVYVETQSPATNANGLIGIEIGKWNDNFRDFLRY